MIKLFFFKFEVSNQNKQLFLFYLLMSNTDKICQDDFKIYIKYKYSKLFDFKKGIGMVI